MSSYNQRRAMDGIKTLRAYQELRKEPDAMREEDDEQYIDLLTDLLHAAESNGLDADNICALALVHMQAERDDEELNAEEDDGQA